MEGNCEQSICNELHTKFVHQWSEDDQCSDVVYCYKGHAQSVEQLAVNPSRTKVNNVNVFVCVVCLYMLVCLSVSMCITVCMFVCV